jgi:hypothetical protein
VAQIIDSYGALDPQAVRSAGYVGVARYIAQMEGKCITPDEFRSYLAQNLTVTFVYEDNANDGLGGFQMGQQKGHFARQVLESLGIDPALCVVHFGYDFNAAPSQFATCWECQLGFVQTCGCVNAAYGEGPLLQYLFARGTQFGWEVGSRDWNEGIAAGQLYQARYSVSFGGGLVDVDDILALDYGQWPRPSPTPPAPQPSKEDLMNVIFTGSRYVCVGVSPAGHPLVFVSADPAGPWSVCDITDDIHGQDPTIPVYTVQT